jgi:multiple sugar transport system permease protein
MTATIATPVEHSAPVRHRRGRTHHGAAGPLFVAPFLVLFLLLFLAPLG